MSDITLQLVQAPSIGIQIEGETPLAILTFPTGTAIPTPQGPLPIPVDTFRIPVPKELAQSFGEKLVEAAEQLPDPKPHVEVAQTLNEDVLRQAQDMERKFRDGSPAS